MDYTEDAENVDNTQSTSAVIGDLRRSVPVSQASSRSQASHLKCARHGKPSGAQRGSQRFDVSCQGLTLAIA